MKITLRSTHGGTSLAGIALIGILALSALPAASGAETWKEAFENICSKVEVSQTLSIKDLEALIAQSDKLTPEIQKSDDPSKKVYLRRLKNCRSMFEFAIDSKKSGEK